MATDLFGKPSRYFSWDDKIKCVARELAMRKRVYPKWIADGRLTDEKAEWEIGCLEAIMADIKGLAGRKE